MSDLQNLRNALERKKGKRDQVEISIQSLTEKLQDTKFNLLRHEEARVILQTVGLETQRQLQYHISDITSLALEAVFEDPYELIAEFVERRNKTECDLSFTRNGSQMDPMDSTGGGAVDVASFALRIAGWSMQSPKRRNVIILDEPFKNLDNQTDRMERASQMLKELSERLGLQFIIVTHEDTLTQHADRVFRVRQSRKGISYIKIVYY